MIEAVMFSSKEIGDREDATAIFTMPEPYTVKEILGGVTVFAAGLWILSLIYADQTSANVPLLILLISAWLGVSIYHGGSLVTVRVYQDGISVTRQCGVFSPNLRDVFYIPWANVVQIDFRRGVSIWYEGEKLRKGVHKYIDTIFQDKNFLEIATTLKAFQQRGDIPKSLTILPS